MNRSTRRNVTYSLKIASMFKVVLCTTLLAASGLTYVYLKNGEQQCGKVQRQLEVELTKLKAGNEVVNSQIAALSSRAYLEKKLAKETLGLVPIANDQLVHLNSRRERHDGLRMVSNGFRK